jgi:hypothetical protein
LGWGLAKNLTPQPPSLTGKGEQTGRLVLAGLVAVNLGCLALNLLKFSSFWFLWVSPAVLLLYAVGTRSRTPAADAPGSPAPDAREAVPV